MSDKIRDLIANIATSDYSSAEDTFSDIMLQKVGDAMDIKRVEVAQSMFNAAMEETDVDPEAGQGFNSGDESEEVVETESEEFVEEETLEEKKKEEKEDDDDDDSDEDEDESDDEDEEEK